MEKRFYTTFEIGKICGVFPSTVINWIKEGRLKASQTPGGHRRVTHADLSSFMHECGYPPLDATILRKRIMIVDDDPSVCRMLKRAFEVSKETVDVETVSSGIDALVTIGKNPPDLVILDVVMPIMDGASLCASLKENPATRGVKLIAITGKRLLAKKQRFIQDNTDAFMRKPLDIRKLLAVSASLLRVPLSRR
ncbi:MAG: response regulator [Elusimicrobiota bacterium]